MYLHLGQSVVVPFRDVVGIFDLDNTTASHRTRSFLTRAEKEGRVVNVSEDLPAWGGTAGGRSTSPSSLRPRCCAGPRAIPLIPELRPARKGGRACFIRKRGCRGSRPKALPLFCYFPSQTGGFTLCLKNWN